LKKTVSILLLVALASQFFYQLDFYAYFKLNEDYIANNLCENRNKPELRCHGKCFLMKKIKEAHQKQENQDIKNKEIVFVINQNYFSVCCCPVLPVNKKISHSITLYQSPFHAIVAPPPDVLIYM